MRRVVALTSLLLVAVLAVPAVCAAAPGIVPEPAAVKTLPGQAFTLDRQTRIAAGGGAAVHRVALGLARSLRPSTGYALPIAGPPASTDEIALSLTGRRRLGREGYRIAVTRAGIRLLAHTPPGLYRALSTPR